MNWRPDNWVNPYKDKEDCLSYQEVEPAMHYAFENGADAMLKALYKMAEESPTKTFIIDSGIINIYEAKNET